MTGILSFNIDDENDSYFHHEVQLTDQRTKGALYDKLTFIYLEVPQNSGLYAGNSIDI